MLEVFVRSRSGAQTFRSEKPWAAIQISASRDWPRLDAAHRMAVLQLTFPDRALPDPEHPAEKLFSEAHADQILDFVQAWRERIDGLLVHCEAGASRSPAVAAGVTRIFLQGDYLKFFNERSPNIRVYGILFARAVQRGLCAPPED